MEVRKTTAGEPYLGLIHQEAVHPQIRPSFPKNVSTRANSDKEAAQRPAQASRRERKLLHREHVEQRSRSRTYSAQSVATMERVSTSSDNSGISRINSWLWMQQVSTELEANDEAASLASHNDEAMPSSTPISRRGRTRRSQVKSHAPTNYKPAVKCSKATASTLRWREMGSAQLGGRTLRTQQLNLDLRTDVLNRFAPWRIWGNASKDVITAVWGPDGRTFAVGASSNLDLSNIQYNDRRTLLFGNIEHNSIFELDDHKIDRPKPAEVSSGANALADTYNTTESQLFTTVTAVCFDHEGQKMFSGSYDKTVKVWDLAGDRPTCTQSLLHDSNVELVDYATSSNLLATAQDQSEQCIRVYGAEEDRLSLQQEFSKERVVSGKYKPTCIRFGTSYHSRHLLLAGFGEAKDDYMERDRNGDICLWDVASSSPLKLTSNSNIVFDIAWHPQSTYFAAALAPGSGVNLTYRQTKSLVRTWSPLEFHGRVYEFECPAVDVNELMFHPTNSYLISASCTDGKTYMWDQRNPDNLLHTFSHGHPIDEVDSNLVEHLGYPRARETIDTGVRLCLWGPEGRFLYTGSSDGVIKQWDPSLSPESALVRVVSRFDSGIMAGAFSPDRTNLLVGLAKGSVHLLSSAPPFSHPASNNARTRSLDEDELLGNEVQRMQFVPAPSAPGFEESETPNRAAADALVASGQISIHPTLGAGRGPLYQGPYASWARTQSALELDPDVLANQLDPEQWKKGMRSSGQPAVHASSRRNWLVHEEMQRSQQAQQLQHSQPLQEAQSWRPPEQSSQLQAQRPHQERPILVPSASAPAAISVPTTPSNAASSPRPWSSSRPRPEFRYPPVAARRDSTPSRNNHVDKERIREEVRRLAQQAEEKGDVMCLDD